MADKLNLDIRRASTNWVFRTLLLINYCIVSQIKIRKDSIEKLELELEIRKLEIRSERKVSAISFSQFRQLNL